jgi:hypothetical protein
VLTDTPVISNFRFQIPGLRGAIGRCDWGDWLIFSISSVVLVCQTIYRESKDWNVLPAFTIDKELKCLGLISILTASNLGFEGKQGQEEEV